MDPELIHRYRGFKKEVTDVKFCPTNKQVAASSADHSILIWNFGGRDTDTAFKYEGHTDAVLGLDFSNSGRLLASCSRDKTVRIWVSAAKASISGHSAARSESTDFRAHSGPVRSVQFSIADGGHHILTCSDDKSIKVWTLARNKFVASYADHSNWVRCARWAPDNSGLIVSCSDDKTIKLWDEKSGKLVHSFVETKGFAYNVEFHPSGVCVGAATSDRKVKIYDIRAKKLQQLYDCHKGPVTQISFHESGNYLASSSQDGFIKLFDLLEARPIYDLKGHNKAVNAVSFSPKGDYMATGGGNDNLVFVWKTNLDAAEAGGQGSQRSVDDARSAKARMEVLRKEIAKCDILTEKMQKNHQDQRGDDGKENVIRSNENEERLKTENTKLVKENNELKTELEETKFKMNTLMETVILLEKRITLMEDQMKLSNSLHDGSKLEESLNGYST